MMKNMQTAINLDDSYRGRCARCDDEMWEDCPPVEIETDIENTYNVRPELGMVNSSRGITNFHVPSDMIIDATMPVIVRDGGQMWVQIMNNMTRLQ